MCNRSPLTKICRCCFFDMLLYSNKLSSITTLSSLIISKWFPACFSYSNNFNRSHFSFGSDVKNILFELPEEEIVKPGDLGNFIGVRL